MKIDGNIINFFLNSLIFILLILFVLLVNLLTLSCSKDKNLVSGSLEVSKFEDDSSQNISTEDLDIKIIQSRIGVIPLENVINQNDKDNTVIRYIDPIVSDFKLQQCSGQSQTKIDSFVIVMEDDTSSMTNLSKKRQLSFNYKLDLDVYLNPLNKHRISGNFGHECDAINGPWSRIDLGADLKLFHGLKLNYLQEFYIDAVIVNEDSDYSIYSHFFTLPYNNLSCDSNVAATNRKIKVTVDNPLMHLFNRFFVWDLAGEDNQYLYEKDHENFLHTEVPYKIKLTINQDEEIEFRSNHLRSVIIHYPEVIYRIALNDEGREFLKQQRKRLNISCEKD